MSIQETFAEYLTLHQELSMLRKQQKTIKKNADELEKKIKQYMTDNDMDSIALKEGEIVLYNKKIPQTFKKETLVEKLTEKLQNLQQAEELTDSILQNKKFVVEEKIKAVIKKRK